MNWVESQKKKKKKEIDFVTDDQYELKRDE